MSASQRAVTVLLSLAAVGGIAFTAARADDRPRPVRVQTVVFGSPRSEVTYAGTVQARVQASLGFRIGGKVTERLVEIGQGVVSGQVLARLDPADARLSMEAAALAVRAAEAETVNARADYQRYLRLGRNSPAYIASEFDRRQAAIDGAEARLAQAQRQLGLARDQLDYTALVADADGVVTGLTLEAGQVVATGQTVLTLAHSAETEVVVDVPENRLPDIRAADMVTVRLWSDPDRALAGRVRELGALADSASRTFAVKVSLTQPRDAGAGLGMTAFVRFSHDTGRSVARLPAGAVVSVDGAPSVWVLAPGTGRAVARPVRVVAWLGDGQVEIADGVPPGAQVVTGGAATLDASMRVTPWAGAVR